MTSTRVLCWQNCRVPCRHRREVSARVSSRARALAQPVSRATLFGGGSRSQGWITRRSLRASRRLRENLQRHSVEEFQRVHHRWPTMTHCPRAASTSERLAITSARDRARDYRTGAFRTTILPRTPVYERDIRVDGVRDSIRAHAHTHTRAIELLVVCIIK